MTTNDLAHAQTVTFESDGATLRGHLYTPSQLSRETRVPGVIVTGSWTTVKEQMPALYARRLAERGFVTLTFDFRHWGESEGDPRHLESPRRKIEDIVNAAIFLRARPEVMPDRVGGLAICASAGYMAHAIAGGAPFRSLVLVAAWLHDPATVPMVYGGNEGVARRMSAAEAARLHFERTGQMSYVPAYDPENSEAAMFFPLEYYARPERGAVPEWTNRFAVTSWSEWLTFDALASAPSVSVPTLMVHSDEAALPENARRFFAALPGPKHLFWTAGTQTDFYDREPQVSLSVDAAVAHFSRTLGTPVVPDAVRDCQAISDTVTTLLQAVDRRDWSAVRAVLANELRTDYTSLFGGSAQMQSATTLIDGWRGLLQGFDATQHLTGPILADVSGDAARAHCAVTAVHQMDGDQWTPSGHYEIGLVRTAAGWAISAITYTNVLVVGDVTFPEKARARALSASHHGTAAKPSR